MGLPPKVPDVSIIGWQWCVVIEFYVKLTLYIVSYNSVQNGFVYFICMVFGLISFLRPFNTF